MRSFHKAQTAGEIKIEENVPASSPTIMGNANTRIDETPIIATIEIVRRVVTEVFTERIRVSLIEVFAINVAELFLKNKDLVFSLILSKIIIVLFIE